MAAVSVTTTATRLDSASKAGSGISGQGSSIIFYNNGSVTVFAEKTNGVTTSTGIPVPAGTWSPGIDLDASEALYGVVASGTADVRTLETGV